jgi:hypothetical protein
MATATILNCRNFRTLVHINFSGDAKRNMETNKKEVKNNTHPGFIWQT